MATTQITFEKQTIAPEHLPFIASANGLVLKTHEIPATLATNGVVPAGTIFPANNATAIGIVYEDVEVKAGSTAGSIICAGYIYKDRLPKAPAELALPELQARGLVFWDTAPVFDAPVFDVAEGDPEVDPEGA